MQKKLLVLGLFAFWGASASIDLHACGNKFVTASRGTRFGKSPVARQAATILVYANPASSLQKTLGDVPVEAILRKAGYQPTMVADSNELDQALRQGGWDLVLADLTDSADLREQLQGNEAPMVVAVVHEPTRSTMAQAKKDYERVLKAPFKSRRLLEAIDDAVALRAKRTAE